MSVSVCALRTTPVKLKRGPVGNRGADEDDPALRDSTERNENCLSGPGPVGAIAEDAPSSKSLLMVGGSSLFSLVPAVFLCM